jgi:uncharacterized protein
MSESKAGVTRREFVKGTAMSLGGAGAVLGLSGAVSGEETGVVRMPTAVLGRTGAEVSRLGIGCAYFRRKQVSVEQTAAVLHRAVELGVTYLDTAPNYGTPETGFSEEKMGPTIKGIRDKVFLVTKTEESTYEGTWKLLRQSLNRLQTDHLDLVHLHNLCLESRFPDLKLTLSEKGALGALREAKKQGVIRFIGASGHLNPSRFHAVLDTGDMDAVMCAVNFVVQHTYDFESKVFARARSQNIGLVAMKVLGGAGGGDKGFSVPEEYYERAIRYALSIPGLACAIIGIDNVEHLEKAAQTAARCRPLSEEEAYALSKVGLEMAGTPTWKTIYGTPVM